MADVLIRNKNRQPVPVNLVNPVTGKTEEVRIGARSKMQVDESRLTPSAWAQIRNGVLRANPVT